MTRHYSRQTDNLRYELMDWAQWHETESGYSDSTTIWRAMMASSNGAFVSSLPPGCIPPARLYKLVLAMQALDEDPCASACVGVTREVYKAAIRPGQSFQAAHEAVGAAWAKSWRTVYRMRGAGEKAIRLWLSAN
jgi:hypothetical protein